MQIQTSNVPSAKPQKFHPSRRVAASFNQPGERMAAGERLAQFRGPEAAAIAHFFR